MALAGEGVLAIWNGIAPEAEAEFVAWHIREHIPERVAVPGFLKGRRYVAIAGRPKYFNFYETETVDALRSPDYLARLNAPSDWTRQVVAHFRETSRTLCRVAFSAGQGDGACICAIRLTSQAGQELLARQVTAAILTPLLALPGIVGVHLLEGQSEAAGHQTAEKALRDRPDETADWILLIEAVDLAPLESAVAGPASATALAAAGGYYAPDDCGFYRLQYGLSRSQLV